MKVSFEKKFLLIFLLIALSVFTFSVATYRNNKSTATSNYWLNHTHEVLYRSEKVLSDLKDIETSVRGFAITQDTSFLQPFYQSKDSVLTDIKKLETLTKDNPLHRLSIDTLYRLSAKRVELSTIISTINFDKAESRNLLLSTVREGKPVMDKIRNLINTIEREENRLLVLREKANNENLEKFKTGFYILFGGIFFVFVLAYFIMRYNFFGLQQDKKALDHLNTRLNFLNKKIDDIIEGISDPFYALDENRKFIYLNKAAQNKLGYDKGSFIGKDIFEIFPGYKETITGQNMLLAQQTQKPLSFEAYDDVLKYWQDLSIYPTAEGITVYLKDATERKANEMELVRTKQFLEETNEVAIVGGWELDINKGTIYWTSITRFIHEVAAGFEPDLENGIHFYKEGRSRETITKLVNQAIEKGTEWDAELQIITAKGNERWVRVKGKADCENSICLRLFGSFQDITDTKEKEKELKSLNASIEETNKELALKNEELERFAYVASHDLQEPLRMITGFLSKIETKYKDLLDDEGRKYISFVVDAAMRMRQLITDILDYSRLGSVVASHVTNIDLNILVADVIQSLVGNRDGPKADIELDRLPTIRADQTSMEQLFSNLVSNALKYQLPGNTPVVTIKVEDKTDHWIFSIADNGIGIDPKFFHKVFNVFQRLHTKTQFSGTGIGLAICKRIIHHLKGEIWIDSEQGKGTTFYFTIMK